MCGSFTFLHSPGACWRPPTSHSVTFPSALLSVSKHCVCLHRGYRLLQQTECKSERIQSSRFYSCFGTFSLFENLSLLGRGAAQERPASLFRDNS